MQEGGLNLTFKIALYLLLPLFLLLVFVLSKNPVRVAAFGQNSLFTDNLGIGAIVYDTIPPTTTITNPANNSLLKGQVSYSATASDNVGVSKVEFYVDNGLVGTGTTAPYSTLWDTITSLDGLHSLFTKAYDVSGNSATSSAVLVTTDNTPPQISLTSPSSGSLLSGNVSLQASASDANGVSSVTFYVDGSSVGTATSNPYTLSWNSQTVGDGNHNLTASAVDSAGNSTSSSAVLVTVDNTAPTVSLTSPVNGAAVSGVVSLTAAASDAVGVTKVEFYVDGNLLGTSTGSSYSVNWDTTIYANNTSHTIYTKAYDGAGNVGTSATITVTVLDITPPLVDITYPLNGSTVPRNLIVTITADSSDVSGVSKVEFRVNGVLKCTDTTVHYFCNWFVPAKKGVTYTLQARSYDNAGNTSTNTVTVTSQ